MEKRNTFYNSAFLFSAVVFYIVALLLYFLPKGNKSSAVLWFCLGSVYLCLYGSRKKQQKESRKSEERLSETK